ncbi:Plasma membrane sulfite pump involved in sulfite metabolism [Coemansia spiralis]|uniref:Plasma membrane sulfite pump involved in sulfite metabolism n=1 Tax=Coemansia spiralis TaxID=417178 RepID=A0A9W8L610_9FUNG|nr:Plasma membrane sulfite pump involved in sulfite metabolism [Coemansia spiralis]
MHKLESRSDIIRGFSPAWFITTMGTGIVGTLLYNFPYHSRELQYLSWGISLINLVLFITCCVLFLWRLAKHRDFYSILIHPQQSMLLGAIPMGLCTLIVSLVSTLKPYNLSWMPPLALTFWCIDVVLSLLSFIVIPFLVTTHQKHALDTVNASLLLPAVPTIVAATGGAIVASVHDGSVATTIVTISYMLWAMGMGVAMLLTIVYLVRLVIHKLPPKEAIATVFIPLGPFGQASYGIQLLGVQAARLFPTELPQIANLGQILQSIGFFVGLLIWSLATWWFAHAVYAMIYTRVQGRIPFHLGWWALIFPISTFAASTNSLWNMTGYTFFGAVASLVIVGVALLWLSIVVVTICYAWTGELFKAASVVRLELQTPEPEDCDSEGPEECLE